uniref:HMG box domain-containing protein n=1 Tax=viral metagenome TaxID=1070528 RepID=A0A6C0C6J9_9ZZZZ
MSITAAKLAMLADRYGFDLDEAREYIGLPPTKKTRITIDGVRATKDNCEKKERCCSLCGKTGHNKITCPNEPTKPAATKPAATKPTATKPTATKPAKQNLDGYNLYIQASKDKVSTEMKGKLPPGSKLQKKTLMNMLDYDWNKLDANKRNKWIRMAQS